MSSPPRKRRKTTTEQMPLEVVKTLPQLPTSVEDEEHKQLPPRSAGPAFRLTPAEDKLFRLLREMCDYFQLKTTMRVAGGWVRDKLMNRVSDDVDIALDNMMGQAFANKINEFLKLKGLEQHHVGVIKQNPEQSKHLEVAALHIFGLSLDVNNLRTEHYTGESRIPQCEIGTPLEDALRRDFTINSLFYNINEEEVEDFCQQGLADLRQRVIRTPLPPLKTFMDDPLRVLRAVRFAGRFHFRLDEDLLRAAQEGEVKRCLLEKVSRERIGIELFKMLGGRGTPFESFRLLCAFGLFRIIFLEPEEMHFFGSSPHPLPRKGKPAVGLSEVQRKRALSPVEEGETVDQASLDLLTPVRMELEEKKWDIRTFSAATVSTWCLRCMASAEGLLRRLAHSTASNELEQHFPSFAAQLARVDKPTGPRKLVHASSMLVVPSVLEIGRSASIGDAFEGMLSPDTRRTLLLAAFLMPYYGHWCLLENKKQGSVAHCILRTGLRFATRLAEATARLQRGVLGLVRAAALHSTLHGGEVPSNLQAWVDSAGRAELSQTVGAAEQTEPARLQLFTGLVLQDLKTDWPFAFLLALMLDPLHGLQAGHPPLTLPSARPFYTGTLSSHVLSAFFLWLVRESDLLGCWSWRPIVNGRRVSAALGVKGKAIGEAVARVRRWQLLHPKAMVEDCESFLGSLKL